MKTMFDDPFTSVCQRRLLQAELFSGSITDVGAPAERFLAGRDGFFLSSNCCDLVSNGDDFSRGPLGVAASAPDVLGLTFLLAFKGVGQQVFDSVLFEDDRGSLDQLGFILYLALAACRRWGQGNQFGGGSLQSPFQAVEQALPVTLRTDYEDPLG